MIGVRVRTMVAHRDLVAGLETLEIGRERPVIVHSSLSAFGHVAGGAKAVVDALLATFDRVMAPVFTYKTMVIPETGPAENGMDYSRGRIQNPMAQFWSPDMPADRLMGAIPEALRIHRKAARSNHPILSFSGVGVEDLLDVQNGENPFTPLEALADAGGWVLLLGVGHSVNTSLHFAEQLAGRKVFTRWALTRKGVQVCQNFPGCSNGFDDLAPRLHSLTRLNKIGEAAVRALPAAKMIEIAAAAFGENPHGYLCKRVDCSRCDAVRKSR